MSALHNVADQILEVAKKAAEVSRAIEERHRHALTDREIRIMEYFWDRGGQRIRRMVPAMVLIFFERDREPPGNQEHVTMQTAEAVGRLVSRKYVRLKLDMDANVELDVDGIVWLKDRHPLVLQYWQKLLELTPPTLSLVVAAVGFVASVAGLIQFVDWTAGR
jgi:hypothetical protein